jgi:DNA-binding LacI/PurR family transcriptional regulator
VPRMIPFHYVNRRLVAYGDSRGLPPAHQSTLGAVVLATGLAALDPPSYVRRLCTYGHSVVLIDDMRTIDSIDNMPSRGRALICVPVSDFEAGRRVGASLVSLGHRRVAWLSPFGDVAWSRERLAGLRSVVESCDKGEVAVYEGTVSGSSAEEWAALLACIAAGEKSGSRLAPIVRETLTHRETAGRFGALRVEQRRRELLQPRIDELLARREVTAIVAASDAVAMVCMERLAQRGIDVPRQMSVVSFDDRPEASYLNITSYTFNAPGMAEAALAFLLRGPAAVRKEKRPEIVQVPGRLVMRHSLAALPSADRDRRLVRH